MTESRDYLEMSFRSIECFKDGVLDLDELNQIVDIALRDGVVDDNEKRVLKSIIDRLTPAELDGELGGRVTVMKTTLGL